MSKMVVGTTSPTPALEAKDPAQADQIYQAWLEHLKKLARNDKKKYPHVFNENMSYGFHRNLYGLKPFAIIVLLCCVVISSGAAWHNWQQSKLFPKQDLICLGVFVCDLLFWVFCVSCAMVKQVAYEYAQRLIEDCVPEVKAARKPKEL